MYNTKWSRRFQFGFIIINEFGYLNATLNSVETNFFIIQNLPERKLSARGV